jgi:hypothetical protein
VKQRFGALQRWAVLLAFCVMSTLHAAPDHTHLAVVVEIPAGETSGLGDALGVYAVQLQPCQVSSELTPHADPHEPTRSFSQLVVERLLSAVSGTAYANHRERFDGPAASEFRRRVALDRAGNTSLGELVVPSARYCGVLLTLARLPAIDGLLALENSVRLSAPGTASLGIAFRESITLSLSKPWLAEGAPAQLKITLRPRATQALLAQQTDDFGVLSQRVMARLAEASSAAVSIK